MIRPIVCLVTDGRGQIASTLDRIRTATAAGADVIQIRERLLPDRALLDLTRRSCAVAQGTAARVLVNDRLDVALAANAHGVHLRATAYSAARVRPTVDDAFLIGRSVHTLDEAMAAEREGGCDYLLFGTVFESSSKPAGHAVAGVEGLRVVCTRVSLPVVAIGGITPANVAEIARAGAAGVAAISLFGDVESIPSSIELLRRSFDT